MMQPPDTRTEQEVAHLVSIVQEITFFKNLGAERGTNVLNLCLQRMRYVKNYTDDIICQLGIYLLKRTR